MTLIGRPRIGAEVAQGLSLTGWRGGSVQARPGFAERPEAASDAGLVLVTVKSADTQAAAQALRPHLMPGALVVSFQNGVGNAQVLERDLGRSVLAGMVGFNVAALGQGRFHQGTEGVLHLARANGLPLDLFARAGLAPVLHDDMAPVLWAKLLLNLNNAVNALSGLPLREELSQRAYRRCLALAQDEALVLLAMAGQPLARLSPLPARWIPAALRLPDALFRVLAGRMLRIDPLARSSMADDLARGRRPEIDWINGEVLRLAARLGHGAPVNARLCALIEQATSGTRVSGPDLLAQLQAVSRARDLPRAAHRR